MNRLPRPADVDVSVVVVNWNTRELLAECLNSVVAAGREAALEVWVVDNGSSDGSVEMVRARYPAVHLIANAENVGFARGNNQAIPRCAGRYVLLLNSDACLLPQALGRMLAHARARPQLGVVAPLLVAPDGRPQMSCARSPTPWRELVHMMHLSRILPGLLYRDGELSLERPSAVEVVQGACMLVRRDALLEVGGFDDGYFMYSEEVELCERLRRAGWGIEWLPAARVVHHGGASTRAAPESMFLALYGSKVRFYRRNRGPGTVLAYKALLLVAALARVGALAIWPLVGRRQRQQLGHTARRYLGLMRALPAL